MFDLICIGGGSGGLAMARRAAEYGARVALIEPQALGGTCVNVGCVPKKLLWYVSQTVEALHNAPQQALSGVLKPVFDWALFKQQRDAYIQRLNGIYAEALQKANIQHIQGFAEFIDANTVQVGEQHYRAKHIVIATGSRPVLPHLEGVALIETSDDFFSWEALPHRVALVGGGYIACELAGVLASLGCQVDLIVRGERLLRHLDSDITAILAEALQEQGVKLHFKTEVTAVSGQHGDLSLTLNNGEALPCERVIWATGRIPNSEALQLSRAGVKVDARGFIKVDRYQNTSTSGIYALGDVTTAPALTPVAIAAARRLAARLFLEQDTYLNHELVPSVIFTHPPIASIGYGEEAAQSAFDAVKVYRARFRPMSRVFAAQQTPTLMKLICRGAEEKIIGMQMIGDGADEMLQGFAVALQMGARKADFDATLAIHPIAAEEWVTMR